MFSTEFFWEEGDFLLFNTHFLLAKRYPAILSVGLKKLDDKWPQKSVNFFAGAGHVTSQISTQLPASKSPSVTGSADKKWWGLPVPVLFRLPVGTPSDDFCRFQSVQTTGWVPC